MARWIGRIDLNIDQWLNNHYQRVFYAFQDVIKEAEDNAKKFTLQRPSLKSGKSGRVETEDMVNSIISKTYTEGMDRIIGEFGFIDEQQLYFKLQTVTGFRHWISGDFIEPTFALRDAEVYAISRVRDVLKKEFSN